MRPSFRRFVVILLSVLCPLEAMAMVQAPTLRFGLGMSSLSFLAGNLLSANGSSGGSSGSTKNSSASTQTVSLGGKLTLNPMFLWDVPSMRLRTGPTMIADIGSNFGFVPIMGIGWTAVFYPLGISTYKEIKEDGTEMFRSKMSPYFQASMIPVKFSANFGAQTQNQTASGVPPGYFNVMILETSFGAGLDYPFSSDLVFFLGLHYRFAALQQGGTDSVKYTGIMIQLGVMTNFF